MNVIEQFIEGKISNRKCEDGIVVTKNYIAVIDGSTSKASVRHSMLRSNGRYCMQIITSYIKGIQGNVTAEAFCQGVSIAVAKRYKKKWQEHLAQHPEDRMTASAVIYNRLRREIWMIGDCICMIDAVLYENSKAYEAELAAIRAEEAKRLLSQGMTIEDLQDNDLSRKAILPRMINDIKEQNVNYAVIDGYPIPMNKVRIFTLDFSPHEIILATDGYPFLLPTFQQSEAALSHQLQEDPLCINTYKATKGLYKGNKSFDDRAYIRFKV